MPEDPAFMFFNAAWTAMVAGDLARLEELTHLSPFPCATDGWLNRHWLTNAIDAGNPKAVIWVLSKGPHIHYVGDDGFTALKSALQTEVDWMHTSNPLAQNADQAADLTICLIDLLLAAGADINQRFALDDTALHVAGSWSSARVVRHLLAKGADPFVWDSDFTPRQPADVAKDAERWEVAAILRAAMGQTPAGLPLPFTPPDRKDA